MQYKVMHTATNTLKHRIEQNDHALHSGYFFLEKPGLAGCPFDFPSASVAVLYTLSSRIRTSISISTLSYHVSHITPDSVSGAETYDVDFKFF